MAPWRGSRQGGVSMSDTSGFLLIFLLSRIADQHAG
jgi:hypothetical protein